MTKDTDWLYKAFSVPWLSHDPVNLVEISGLGFASVFDETTAVGSTTNLSVVGWEFVCFWRPEFPGWNPVGFLVFRKRAG